MECGSQKDAKADDSETQKCPSDAGDDDKDGSSSGSSLDVSDLYNPDFPNVYSPSLPGAQSAVQARAPSGVAYTQQGQSEVITSAGGRRYVAQFFEQTSDTSERNHEVPPTTETPDDSHMAKALCINLLTELVKGSYQLLKNSTPSADEPSSKTLQNQIADSYARMQKRIDVAMNSSDSTDSDEEGPTASVLPNSRSFVASSGDSDEHNLKENSDFKKAKHSWQIKRSQTGHESGDPGTSLIDTESHKRERKRTIEGSESETDSSITDLDTAVTKRRKCSESESSIGHKTKGLDNHDDVSDESSDSNHSRAEQPRAIYEALTHESCDALNTIRRDCIDNQQTQLVSGLTSNETSEQSLLSEAKGTKNAQNMSGNTSHDSSRSETHLDNSSESAISLDRNGQETDTSQSELEGVDNMNDSLQDGEELTYLEKWQKHHMAKAIVDNAINKTLDEMALGPRDRTYHSSQTQRIEDAGVSQVISARGLRRAAVTSQPADNLQLYPFINQLTQASEDMFVETLGVGTRFSASFNLAPNPHRPQPPPRSAAAFFSRPSLSERVQSYTLTEERGGLEQSSQSQCNPRAQQSSDNHVSNDDKVNSESPTRTESSQHSYTNETLNSSHSCDASTSQAEEQSLTEAVNVQISCASNEGVEIKPSHSPNSAVLERALEAVIYDKGLQF